MPAGVAFIAKPVPTEVLVSQVKAAAERVLARVATRAIDAKATVIPFPKISG
jgi:hypothetical protein